jgi:beta-glucosidase
LHINSEIGIALSIAQSYPYDNNEDDIQAAIRANDYANNMYLEPLFLKRFPEGLKKSLSGIVDIDQLYSEKILNEIAQPIDFLGINYYSSNFVKHDNKELPFNLKICKKDNETTDMDWEVYPQGLYDCLTDIKNRFGDIKIFITENGAAYKDKFNENGEIEDIERQNYIQKHIEIVKKAIDDGVNVAGYYVWSLMDNFEWSWGYSKTFGLVHIDYKTQKRTIKNSGKWYAKVIKDNGIYV